MARKETWRWARAGMLFAGVWLAYRLRAELLDMFALLAGATAFSLILSPLCDALERRGIHPSIAAGLSAALLLVVLLTLVLSFVPYLVTHTVALLGRLGPIVREILSGAEAMNTRLGLPSGILPGAVDALGKLMPGITTGVARSGMAIASALGKLVFSVVLAFYLLGERRRAVNCLLMCIPTRYRTLVLQAATGCGNALLGYLSGVIRTSLFVGVATFLGLFLIGIRDALLLSVFMGLLEVLPYIGPILAAVPIMLSAFSQGTTQALLALGIVVLVQQIEGNFVSPYFTASSTSVSPLLSLVVVYALGSVWGLWGILLAVPILVTGRSLYWSVTVRRNIEIRRQEMIET